MGRMAGSGRPSSCIILRNFFRTLILFLTECRSATVMKGVFFNMKKLLVSLLCLIMLFPAIASAGTVVTSFYPVWLIAVRQVAAGILFLLYMSIKGIPLFDIWQSGRKNIVELLADINYLAVPGTDIYRFMAGLCPEADAGGTGTAGSCTGNDRCVPDQYTW